MPLQWSAAPRKLAGWVVVAGAAATLVGCADDSVAEPTRVAGLEPALSVAAGANHTCALLENGNVGCWGVNDAGQVGPGAPAHVTSPRGVALDADPVALALGAVHTCAAFSDGSVRCWGDDSEDFLGVDARCAAPGEGCATPPTVVAGISDAVSMAAAGVQAESLPEQLGYTCAVRQDRSLSCWGDNREHQLGRGADAATGVDAVPARVVDADGFALRGITKVTAGDHHACALDDAARVWCWGTAPDAGGDVAVHVVELDGAVDISAGESHTCAVDGSGHVWCWGSNLDWESADPADADTCSISADCVPHPRIRRGISGATAVAVGSRHSCALVDAGEVWCWGSNQYGQLGRGDANLMAEPGRATLTASARSISAGRVHSCVVTTSGDVYCWGGNSGGQLGRAP